MEKSQASYDEFRTATRLELERGVRSGAITPEQRDEALGEVEEKKDAPAPGGQ